MIGLEQQVVFAAAVAAVGLDVHFQVLQLGVEGMPVVDKRQEKIGRTGGVDTILHPLVAEQGKLHRAHTDFGIPGGVGNTAGKKAGGKRQHYNRLENPHRLPPLRTSNICSVESRSRGLTPVGPSLGRITVSSPL